MVLCIGDWRVLVIGLTVPMVTERMWERKLSAYVFEAPLRTAARMLPALIQAERPDLTIALTHIGLRLDRELAEANLGADLIVGGHSHEVLPEGEKVGNALIVQAGSHGRYAGVVVAEQTEERPRLEARIVSL
jgi:2',3'-cyclic-nucleotide 2'-phosphodiesterase (5'-nucleotidase family)